MHQISQQYKYLRAILFSFLIYKHTFEMRIKVKRLARSVDNLTIALINKRMASKFRGLEQGGKWFRTANRSVNGKVVNRVAIIVPYRDRLRNLKIFLQYIHQFLIWQASVNYAVYLVEPSKTLTFNRALLINIGFREALLEYDFECFIIHDVDMLPEVFFNSYMCDLDYPKQMATSISLFAYTNHPYFIKDYMGGVTAFTREQFEMINGYSNLFYGWGGEGKRKFRVFNEICRN